MVFENALHQTDGEELGMDHLADFICWSSVELASRLWAIPLGWRDYQTLATDTTDAVVQDRNVEFTGRYFISRVRMALTPLSKANDSPVSFIYQMKC